MKRFHDETVAVVAMKIKGSVATFGWKFEMDPASPTKTKLRYLHEPDLMEFFPELVSPAAKEEIKKADKKASKERKRDNRNEKRLEKMLLDNPELYFGMYTVRGNKTVSKVVEATPLGETPDETYKNILDRMETMESDYMGECMDTCVRDFIWSRILERHKK